MGQHSPNHQWVMHGHSLFLLTLVRAKGTNISPRVLLKHFLLADRPGRSEYGLRPGTGLTGWDFGDPRACLCHYTTD